MDAIAPRKSEPTIPNELIVGNEDHDDLVKDVEKYEEYCRGVLTPIYSEGTDFLKLYLGDRPDPRAPHEKKWRPNVHVAWPYSGVEAMVATVEDILLSADPRIQPEGVGFEDDAGADKISRILDYFLRRMHFPSLLDVSLREMGIFGTAFRKSIWLDEVFRLPHKPKPEELDAFDKAVIEAEQLSQTPAPPIDKDPEGWELWRQMINESGKFGRIPDPPYEGMREVVRFRGPTWSHVHYGDLRLDPMVENVQKQYRVIHQIVKPNRWILGKAGPEPEKPFDLAQVKAAIETDESSEEGTFFNRWEREQALLMGIPTTEIDHPLYKNKSLLWEVYSPGEKYPHMIVLNKKAIINKTPWKMPYYHQEIPIQAIRNVFLPGKLFGLTELKQNLSTYEEIDKLRNLRLEALILATLPIMVKAAGVGMPAFFQELQPGKVYNIHGDANAFGLLNDKIKVPAGMLSEDLIRTLKQEADETMSTQDIVRGSSAPYSRTTASEIMKRMERALARQKSRVMRVEDEISTAVPQWLSLCEQYAPDDWVLHVAGYDPANNPFQKYAPHEFREAIEKDYRFRGATQSLNRELRAQQLLDFYTHGLQGGSLAPWEARSVLQRAFSAIGEKGAQEVFTTDGADYVRQLAMMQVQAAMQPPTAGEGNAA